jgi:hypothetical protein
VVAAAAALAALLAVASWNLRPEAARSAVAESGTAAVSAGTRTHRWFSALFTSYTLEGIGYIVAGTFLVAAIDRSSPGWVGGIAWVLVGLAAVPSSALWAWLGHRWSRPDLLAAALVIQATAIALPAVIGGATAALISAALFGATFIGVSTLALATGAYLRFPRSVALLTAGYSVGQILGPLAVTPLLHHGYHQALILAALVVMAAAAAAAVLRVGFPHQVSPLAGATTTPMSGSAPYRRTRPDRSTSVVSDELPAAL